MVADTVVGTGTTPMASSSTAASTNRHGSSSMFFPSSKIKLLHQRTSLSLAFDRERGWGYQGETAMYIVAIDAKSNDSANKGGGATSKVLSKENLNSNAIDSGTNEENDKMAPANDNSSCKTKSGSATAGATSLDGDGKTTIELALHLRDGCCRVDSVEIFCAAVASCPATATASTATDEHNNDMDVDKDEAPTTATPASATRTSETNCHQQQHKQQQQHYLHPLPQRSITFAHLDPLSIFMTRPSPAAPNLTGAVGLHLVEDNGGCGGGGKNNGNGNSNSNSTKEGKNHLDGDATAKTEEDVKQQRKTITEARTRRYEADAHATRGTKGMTYSLRAASISSALGELRITIAPSTRTVTTNKTGADDDNLRLRPPGSEAEAYLCWKDDLLLSSSSSGSTVTTAPAGETAQGAIESKVNAHMIRHRCQKRREMRFDQVAKSLAEATATMSTSLSSPSSKNNTNATNKEEEVMKKIWPLSAAMKIVVRFSMSRTSSYSTLINHRLHMGGINFIAPPSQKRGDPAINIHPCLSTPHVYTASGSHGDHQGVRSWLPTLDSASPKHRASHELLIKVTSAKDEGLWPVASGEDFGHNMSVCHPILLQLGKNDDDDDDDTFRQFMMKQELKMNDEKKDDIMMMTSTLYQKGVIEAESAWKTLEGGIADVLGRRHARFINDFFYPDDKSTISSGTIPPSSGLDSISSSSISGLNSEMMTQIMLRHNLIRPIYVTSVFSSLTWLPCPSRSIGFAVGPFITLFDQEYFRLSSEDDADDDDSDEDDDDHSNSERRRRRLSMDDGDDAIHAQRDVGPSISSSHPPLSLRETAHELGEGIRQLYFAPRDDRRWIHEDANDIFIFGKLLDTGYCPQRQLRPKLSLAKLRDRQQLEGSIHASTIGVPNRALSLMRDVLALPAYRTSSYTQIWIPYAQWSGDSCGGNMVGCPEVGGCNTFLGGAIMDSTLLPPPGMRLPYYEGGKYLQFLQARNAIRGWVRTALPLGSNDDVGQGYLHALIESFIMSLYERCHGAFGEGGGKGSFFYTKRYAISSGLNSPNLDFLPLVNIEDDEIIGGGLGAIAIEDRGNEHLWRSTNNGTETHTSAIDEFVIGQLQAKDFIDALERTDIMSAVPLPSVGWLGSHQSATFLSHNSASSTSLGCGALDFVHPMGGQMYRATKALLLSKVYEGRSGISNFTRVVRAAFIASFLRDAGFSQVKLPDDDKSESQENDLAVVRHPFVVCVDEIIKKQAITHAIFTRALRLMSGPIHEAYLRGNLVDIERDDNSRPEQLMPEGFPNSYVRGASGLYLRVGVHIEAADGSSAQSTSAAPQSAASVKGTHLHVVAEPVIAEGGSAFGGPVTLRVIENEGQCREFIKTIPEDGSRVEWGPVFLHARPVTTAKQQQAASGISEAPTATAAGNGASGAGGELIGSTAFTNDQIHKGGFQALELIRITNPTPLLWVRVDSQGLYNGRLNIFQQDACLAEQLFHDGDAAGQVEAIRALAERPFKIQGVPKLTNVHDVPIAELPVRVLGDCLRGSVALHCDLPHNPAVRAQAALAIAQWQNNKAPESRDVVGGSAWLGLDLLIQYFRERFYCDGVVMPNNFRRILLHKNIAGVASGGDFTSDGGYQYLDALLDKEERKSAIEFADEVEVEEDEEYRVRSACVTAIASIRAQDGMTPNAVVTFLEEVLLSGDKAAVGSLLLPEEEEQLKNKQDQALDDEVLYSRRIIGPNDEDVSNFPYVSVSLVADALLALCYIHIRPQCDFDPTTGRPANTKSDHPILPLMELCLGWLDWDLERMRLRAKTNKADPCGAGDACYNSVAPSAIMALCHMALLMQITTPTPVFDDVSPPISGGDDSTFAAKRKLKEKELDKATTSQFYIDIFDDDLVRGDAIRAAAAQSVICICCAADRNEALKKEPLGLLVSLEFLLDRILEPMISPGLRLTLALLMLDACTGKICSQQRVGSFCGQNRLCGSGTRFMNGPLGASYGGDNGSALLLTVSDVTYPAANAVNDGARRGLRLLRHKHKDASYTSQTIVRVAKFASKLWRTINGESISPSKNSQREPAGVCAHDNNLRCSLVALWQWTWPDHCYQFLRTQSWLAMEGTPQYFSMGLNHVMKTTEEEKEAALLEDEALEPLIKVVEDEINRQKWRGEMAGNAYQCFKDTKGNMNLTEAGQPLPIVEKDAAWKLGGWVASTAQQRRSQGADGGSAVTKIRLMVKSSGAGDDS